MQKKLIRNTGCFSCLSAMLKWSNQSGLVWEKKINRRLCFMISATLLSAFIIEATLAGCAKNNENASQKIADELLNSFLSQKYVGQRTDGSKVYFVEENENGGKIYLIKQDDGKCKYAFVYKGISEKELFEKPQNKEIEIHYDPNTTDPNTVNVFLKLRELMDEK
jgi:hypothetical protein